MVIFPTPLMTAWNRPIMSSSGPMPIIMCTRAPARYSGTCAPGTLDTMVWKGTRMSAPAAARPAACMLQPMTCGTMISLRSIITLEPSLLA